MARQHIPWSKRCWLMLAGAAVQAAALVFAQAARAQTPVVYTDAASREVVILNSAPDAVLTETASRLAIVLNSETPAVMVEAASREAVLYNSEPAAVLAQSASRETAVYNSEPPAALAQAYSPEAVLYVSESPIVDSFSREVVVYDGYYLPEAFSALRMAGGLQAATPAAMDRFALALQLAKSNRVNALVAARILRIAITLQP